MAGSQAEIDLIVNATRTLSTLDRDVNRLVTQAQANADPLTLRVLANTVRNRALVQADLNRLVADAQRGAPDIRIDVDIDRDRLARTFSDLTQSLGKVGKAALPAIATLGKVGAAGIAVGGAVPAIASVVAAVEQIAPAAAVGTQAFLAMQLVSGTLKLGLSGVQDALTEVFATEPDAEKLAKALENLAPAAREFVLAAQKAKPAFDQLRLDVQQRLFSGLADRVGGLAKAAFPDLRKALQDTADTLNLMGKGVISAASDLAKDGTLGTALKGATTGLQNLVKVPAQATTAFGQLAAAAAPAFDRVTLAAANAATKISEKLNAAFESGALQDAIDKAIDTIAQFADSVRLIIGGLGNIFGGLTENGRGLFEILHNIAEAFNELTASSEFQTILSELALTADTLVKNVLPLLLEAFVQLAPIIEELGPPTRDFLNAIGPELIPLLQQLGPVLLDIAQILADQAPTAIAFAVAAIQDLTAILQGLDFILDNVVRPAIGAIADVINSDFVTSIANLSRAVTDAVPNAGRIFGQFRSTVSTALATVVGNFISFVSGLRNSFVQGIARRVAEAVATVRSLPGRIVSALGNTGNLLFSAGRNLIAGFISGVQSQIGHLISVLGGITNRLPDWKGPADVDARILFRSGQLVMDGFQAGISSRTESLKNQLGTITASIPNFAGAKVSAAKAPASGKPPFNVQVFIGNEQLNPRMRMIADQQLRSSARTFAQGVRR